MKPIRTPLLFGILVIWVLGTLVPVYMATRGVPFAGAAFDWVFQTHTSHVLMHALLYAVLAWLLAVVSSRCGLRSSRAVAAAVMAGVVCTAIFQEAIQVVANVSHVGRDEVFDFLVDAAGGGLGLLGWMRWRQAMALRVESGRDTIGGK